MLGEAQKLKIAPPLDVLSKPPLVGVCGYILAIAKEGMSFPHVS